MRVHGAEAHGVNFIWKAVLTNLPSQRRAHNQTLQRENELLNPVEIEEETLEDLDQPAASPKPLKPWQKRLKSQVSTSAWESVLSWLVQNEDSETTEIWAWLHGSMDCQ